MQDYSHTTSSTSSEPRDYVQRDVTPASGRETLGKHKGSTSIRSSLFCISSARARLLHFSTQASLQAVVITGVGHCISATSRARRTLPSRVVMGSSGEHLRTEPKEGACKPGAAGMGGGGFKDNDAGHREHDYVMVGDDSSREQV